MMKVRATGTSVALGALIGAAVAGGCGPGSGSHQAPPSCLQVQPCGGDVVGTWSFLGACHGPTLLSDLNSQLQAACPGASISAFDVDVSGTVTFNADLTYVTNGMETVSATETIPLSCSGFTSCAAIQSDSPDSTVTCTGTTTCTCRIIGRPAGNETGTYTTSGTSLSMIASDSTEENDAFCVENGRLHILGLNDTTGAVIGDIVAQKQ